MSKNQKTAFEVNAEGLTLPKLVGELTRRVQDRMDRKVQTRAEIDALLRVLERRAARPGAKGQIVYTVAYSYRTVLHGLTSSTDTVVATDVQDAISAVREAVAANAARLAVDPGDEDVTDFEVYEVTKGEELTL